VADPDPPILSRRLRICAQPRRASRDPTPHTVSLT